MVLHKETSVFEEEAVAALEVGSRGGSLSSLPGTCSGGMSLTCSFFGTCFGISSAGGLASCSVSSGTSLEVDPSPSFNSSGGLGGLSLLGVSFASSCLPCLSLRTERLFHSDLSDFCSHNII